MFDLCDKGSQPGGRHNEHEQAAVLSSLLRRPRGVVHRTDGLFAHRSAGGSAHVQAGPRHRDAQHLPVLLGRLRPPDVPLGDKSKNVAQAIIHIEGDPDHPVNRGTLCPKGAGLLDFVHSPNRLKYPEVREPGSNEWKRISWDDAFNRIAELMKDDRDANFIAKNADGVDGQPLADHRLPGRLGLLQRVRLHHPQGRSRDSG